MQKEESLFKHQRDGAKAYDELVKAIKEKYKVDVTTLEHKIELMHKPMEELQDSNVKKVNGLNAHLK